MISVTMPSLYNVRRGGADPAELEELKVSPKTTFLMEIAARVGLMAMFIFEEVTISPDTVIQDEDLWRHRYPLKEATVKFKYLVISIAVFGYLIFNLLGIKTKSRRGASERTVAVLGLTLSVLVTAVITGAIKNTVGRPRPNYLVRCYGVHNYLEVKDASRPCTEPEGNGDLRKSFPSGHSSVAFAGFLYLSLYIAGKLGTFNKRGQGSAWRLISTILPVFAASWVAATRYIDYHHHVEDIIAGSVLGCVIAYLSYVHYYKPLSNEDSHQPHGWKSDATTPTRSSNLSNGHLPHEMTSGGSLSPKLGVTFGGKRYRALMNTGGNINLDVRISRNRSPQDSLRNGTHDKLEPSSYIEFSWDETEEDLIRNEHLEDLRGELIDAFENLQTFVKEDNNCNAVK